MGALITKSAVLGASPSLDINEGAQLNFIVIKVLPMDVMGLSKKIEKRFFEEFL
jgi:hypothetical protein